MVGEKQTFINKLCTLHPTFAPNLTGPNGFICFSVSLLESRDWAPTQLAERRTHLQGLKLQVQTSRMFESGWTLRRSGFVPDIEKVIGLMNKHFAALSLSSTNDT